MLEISCLLNTLSIAFLSCPKVQFSYQPSTRCRLFGIFMITYHPLQHLSTYTPSLSYLFLTNSYGEIVHFCSFAKLPLVLNNTTSVFLTSRNKKLSCSQSFTIESCEFNVVSMTSGHLPEKNRTVSSGYCTL